VILEPFQNQMMMRSKHRGYRVYEIGGLTHQPFEVTASVSLAFETTVDSSTETAGSSEIES